MLRFRVAVTEHGIAADLGWGAEREGIDAGSLRIGARPLQQLVRIRQGLELDAHWRRCCVNGREQRADIRCELRPGIRRRPPLLAGDATGEPLS